MISPVSVSITAAVSPAQSTCITSPGLWFRCMVIGHTGDLLVDIYTAKYGAYLHFTVVLNDGGKGAQARWNGCSI